MTFAGNGCLIDCDQFGCAATLAIPPGLLALYGLTNPSWRPQPWW